MKTIVRIGLFIILLLITAFFNALNFPTLTQNENLKERIIKIVPVINNDSLIANEITHNQNLDTMKVESNANKKISNKVKGKKVHSIKKHHKLLKNKT